LRRKIGLVSSSVRRMMNDDEPALLTVVSGLYAMIDYWGEPKATDREKAKRILKQIECLHLAERPWRGLSQGERQRILIGRALIANPALLLLDEPCAGLDPIAREHFLGFLGRLCKRRAAVSLVFVTHHIEEVVPVFTHLMLMGGGRVVAAGTIKKVLTAQTLSNAFCRPIELEKSDGRYRLRIPGGRQVM